MDAIELRVLAGNADFILELSRCKHAAPVRRGNVSCVVTMYQLLETDPERFIQESGPPDVQRPFAGDAREDWDRARKRAQIKTSFY